MIDSVYKGGFRKKAKCFSCGKFLVKDEPVITDKNRYYCKACGESVRNKRVKLLEGLITNVKGIK